MSFLTIASSSNLTAHQAMILDVLADKHYGYRKAKTAKDIQGLVGFDCGKPLQGLKKAGLVGVSAWGGWLEVKAAAEELKVKALAA